MQYWMKWMPRGIRQAADGNPYSVVSKLILEEATAIGQERHETVGAAMIWDGTSQGKQDYTTEFGVEARRRGLPVFEIKTV